MSRLTSPVESPI